MLLMASLTRAFSYLIAAQVQAVTLILAAYYGGEWLNKNHPISINWYVITSLVSLVAVAQTFYVVIRAAMTLDKKVEPKLESHTENGPHA